MIGVSCEALNRFWEKEGERINDEVEIPPPPPSNPPFVYLFVFGLCIRHEGGFVLVVVVLRWCVMIHGVFVFNNEVPWSALKRYIFESPRCTFHTHSVIL